MNPAISEQLYRRYFQALLEGDRTETGRIVRHLLDENIPVKDLYLDLFQRSLYRVGELWEENRISVAREHLATAVTEWLLSLVYPALFSKKPDGEEKERKKIVISCAANEYHQVGGKIVADIFEMNGWDSYFLGADTPIDQLLDFIEETDPDLVGLSLSVYFNLASLEEEIAAIRSNFPDLKLIVGGQAFRWGGTDTIEKYPRTEYISSLNDLEKSVPLDRLSETKFL